MAERAGAADPAPRGGAEPVAPDGGSGEPAGLARSRLAWLAFGIIAFAGGTILGWSAGLLEAVVAPPPLIRAALVGGSVVVGLALLVRAVRSLETGRGLASATLGDHDLVTLVRGVRYVFLAVAAFAAASGWLVAHPLPLIVALVIAGVDVLETSLLLLVITFRRE